MSDNGGERLSRMQADIEELTRDVKILLRAQVLQGGDLKEHEAKLSSLETAAKELVTHGREVDVRIEKLVSAIGALVRRSE